MEKRRIGKTLVFIMAMSFFIAGCDKLSGLFIKKPAPEQKEYFVPEGKVIARVNEMVITLEELNRYVESRNKQIDDYVAEYKQRYPNVSTEAALQDLAQLGLVKIETTEQKIELLQNALIRQRLLYQEAVDRGLDKKQDVRMAIEEFKMNLLAASLAAEETDNIKVPSDEIEKYYEVNRARFRGVEERRVREIVTRSEVEAKDALIEILQGADFAVVARKYSVSATASKGGDLDFILPGTRFNQFDMAVYSLEVGGVSSIIKNPEASEFYIVKVEEKRGGKEVSLTEAWNDIENQLEETKRNELIDGLVGRLRREVKIDIQTGEIK